jgi:hypothetical protein
MSLLTTKKLKVWCLNPKPMKHNYKTKKSRKAQEGHLEEGKTAKANKWQEKWQAKHNGKEELRKAQNQNKASKKSSNSKTPNSPWNQLPLTLLMQAFLLR